MFQIYLAQSRMSFALTWLWAKLFLPKERFEVVNGCRICYVRAGKGPHTLLCIPGMIGDWMDFCMQLQKLDRDQFTIIAVDPPGYGKSVPYARKNPPECFVEDARFLHGLMEQLNISTYSVFGWSDGGMAAVLLAHQQRHSASVDKLVLVAATSYVDEHEIKYIEEQFAVLDLELTPGSRRHENIRGLLQGQVDGYKKLIAEKDGDICRGVLSEVTNETLILHGAKDELPLKQPQYFADHLPNSEGPLIHPDGGHAFPFTHWPWFNEKLTAFLTAKSDNVQPAQNSAVK